MFDVTVDRMSDAPVGASAKILESQLEGLSDREYVQSLKTFASSHRAVQHPFLDALSAGEFSDSKFVLRDFLRQYYAYSCWFPRYLAAVLDQAKHDEHRAVLQDNLSEERGELCDEDKAILVSKDIDPTWIEGRSHPELFRQLLFAIGFDKAELADDPLQPCTALWREMFLQLCTSSGFSAGVGALGPGTESVVSCIYRRLLVAIERNLQVSRADRVFLDLHCVLDDAHAEELQAVACDLASTPEGRKGLRFGVLAALYHRENFLDAMYRRARAQGRGTASADFVAGRLNRDSLVPQAVAPGGQIIHAQVGDGVAASEFSASRGHPVHSIQLPSNSVSMSLGVLEPGSSSSNHRHAYETLVYVIAGRGYSMIEGVRIEWQRGDAFYVSPWNWHRHVADASTRVEYLAATNFPLLARLGQTVVREEADASAAG